jgi:hypothetical protein
MSKMKKHWLYLIIFSMSKLIIIKELNILYMFSSFLFTKSIIWEVRIMVNVRKRGNMYEYNYDVADV